MINYEVKVRRIVASSAIEAFLNRIFGSVWEAKVFADGVPVFGTESEAWTRKGAIRRAQRAIRGCEWESA